MDCESIHVIDKPLDDLLCSLKYIPTNNYFNIIPVEIQKHILSYLCISGTFICAAVSENWKAILKNRLRHEEVMLGKHCSNVYECKENACFMPQEILSASINHQLPISLSLCHPLMEIEALMILKALRSTENLTINGACCCKFSNIKGWDEVFDLEDTSLMSTKQLEDLFRGIINRVGLMESIEIIGIDLTQVNKDILFTCLLTKIKRLTLDRGPAGGEIVNVDTLIKKLLQKSTDKSISHITLVDIKYPEVLSDCMADALCTVQHVEQSGYIGIGRKVIKRMFENILSPSKKVEIKSIILRKIINMKSLISADNLETVINKMTVFSVKGKFTIGQLQVIKALPDVKVEKTSAESLIYYIKKGTI